MIDFPAGESKIRSFEVLLETVKRNCETPAGNGDLALLEGATNLEGFLCALPTLRALEFPPSSPRFREVALRLFRSRGESCLACSILKALQGVLSFELDSRGDDDSEQRRLPAEQELQFRATIHCTDSPAGRPFQLSMAAWTDGGSFSMMIRSQIEVMEEFRFLKELEGKCTDGFCVCRSGHGV